MRLFLAIDIPSGQKKAMNDQLSVLQKEYPNFIWAPVINYHLTVHFFGEVIHPEQIISKINDLLYDRTSFYLYTTNLGFFMNQQITIHSLFRKERKLLDLMDMFSISFSDPVEKAVPHITVARCRVPSKQQYHVLKKKLERTNIDVSFEVNELVLFESIISKKHPTYRKVMTFPLIPAR